MMVNQSDSLIQRLPHIYKIFIWSQDELWLLWPTVFLGITVKYPTCWVLCATLPPSAHWSICKHEDKLRPWPDQALRVSAEPLSRTNQYSICIFFLGARPWGNLTCITTKWQTIWIWTRLHILADWFMLYLSAKIRIIPIQLSKLQEETRKHITKALIWQLDQSLHK